MTVRLRRIDPRSGGAHCLTRIAGVPVSRPVNTSPLVPLAFAKSTEAGLLSTPPKVPSLITSGRGVHARADVSGAPLMGGVFSHAP